MNTITIRWVQVRHGDACVVIPALRRPKEEGCKFKASWVTIS